MQIKMGQKVPNVDPESFLYAYTYSPDGFYEGMSRMQEDQMNPGQFLLPASSTKVKPNLKEGFIPRWNGDSWDLIERKAAVKKASAYNDEFDQKKERIFADMERNAMALVESKIMAFENHHGNVVLKELEAFRAEVKMMIGDNLRVQLEVFVRAASEEIKARLSADVGEWRQTRALLEDELRIFRSELRIAYDQGLELKAQINEMLKAPTVEEKRSLISKVFNGFGRRDTGDV